MDTEYFDDIPAIGTGSEVAQLQRLQQPSIVQFSLKSTWGTSRLRDDITTSNGGSVAETGGEIQVSTGTNTNGSAVFETLERGQYRSGTWAEPSVGVRIPSAHSLTGDQNAKWGYFDGNNGFGYGVDSNGIYTFRQNGGDETRWRASDWRRTALTTDDLINGLVCHIAFRHYGHGPARWFGEPKDMEVHYAAETPIDRRLWAQEISPIDPNQPLRVEVDNGSTLGSDLSVYVGGRQFALWGGGAESFEQRGTPVKRRGYTISSADTWEPVLSVRRKSTFGPSNRTNSVRAVVSEFDAISTANTELRVTFDATTDASYTNPEGVPADETAIEKSDGAFTVSDDGREVSHGILPASGPGISVGQVRERDRVPMGNTTEVVLWARSSGTPTLEVVSLDIEEQW